jgi:hypothetical protein
MAAKKIDIMDVRQLIQLKIRVETNYTIGSEIIEAMKNFGFYCEELQ